MGYYLVRCFVCKAYTTFPGVEDTPNLRQRAFSAFTCDCALAARQHELVYLLIDRYRFCGLLAGDDALARS